MQLFPKKLNMHLSQNWSYSFTACDLTKLITGRDASGSGWLTTVCWRNASGPLSYTACKDHIIAKPKLSCTSHVSPTKKTTGNGKGVVAQ